MQFVKAIELLVAKCSVSQHATESAYAGNVMPQCNDLHYCLKGQATCVNCENFKDLYQETPAALLLHRKLCRLKDTLVASHLVHPVHKLQGSCMTDAAIYTDFVTCMSWPQV